MRNEIVVMYGLIGTALPRARRMPPTLAVTAKTTLSTGTTMGEEETRSAAAAGG